MPDRYGEPVDPDAPASMPMVDLDAQERENARAAAAQARANCHRCNDDGYRGDVVCDHRDHATPETRAAAMAEIRATLTRSQAS